MADLPDNAPRMFQLPTATSVPWHGNSAETVQSAINSGASIYNQRVQANQGQQTLDQQKQLQQAQIQQIQQQQALAQQKQQQEQGHLLAQNALQAYDSYGDAAAPESFEAFKKGMNLMAPGAVDPNATWTPEMGDALKKASDAFDAATEGKRPWPEAIGVISKVIGQSGKMQREKLMPILGAAQDQFNQGQSTARQQSSQTQDTQRAYAEHAQPLIQNGSTLNTINTLLSQNTATGDAAAKTLIERGLANGAISKEDADKLTSAGGPLEKLSNYWHTIGTGKTFDDTHRKAMQEWVSTKVDEINNTLKATASAFPGASPAQVTARKTGTSKSGKPIFSDDGGKTWQYQ